MPPHIMILQATCTPRTFRICFPSMAVRLLRQNMGPHTLPRMRTPPAILTPILPIHFTSNSSNNSHSSSSSSNTGKSSVLPSKLITAVLHTLPDSPQEKLTVFRGNRPQYNTSLLMQLPSLPKVLIYQRRSLPLYLHIRKPGSMAVTNPKTLTR